MMSPGQQYQHSQPILPAPTHVPNGMSLQSCISPMQPMIPSMPLHHDYAIPQPMFTHGIHSNSTNSPVSGGIVIPASPNGAVFDVNAKWDHLFQGGGIFDMSSLFGFDAEFGHLTPPEFSVIHQKTINYSLNKFHPICPTRI
jgi:hypothetical protein